MAHKTHPKGLRIRGIEDWYSQGFYGRTFPAFLEEDFLIRKFLARKIGEAGVDSIRIERSAGRINVVVQSARPGLIIGRGGSGAEELRKELKGKLITLRKRRGLKGKISELRVEIAEVRHPWLSSALVCQAIARQLEKRIPFRRVLKQALEKIVENKEAQGARIGVAGRLDGAEIARREWLKKGRLPRQTLRANIDYAEGRALCTYGTVGIKVWIYKGDKFD